MQRVMITLLIAFAVGIVLGKAMLPVLHKLKFGQNIYELAPEAHKKKQEDMMNSIVTVGTSVNESTQSIHALIEEMTEATGCVSQAMGDITVSMESTVASIQEHDRTDSGHHCRYRVDRRRTYQHLPVFW